jgi:hypothetical protein
MDHVSDGTTGKNNPLLAMFPNPFHKTAPIEDALVPKGCAVYNLKALMTHADDIGWIDKHAPYLKRFVPPHAANAGANSSTEPFFTISLFYGRAGWAMKFAGWELDRTPQMVNKARGVAAANRLNTAAHAIEAHDKAARPLAMQERTPETEPAREALAHALVPLIDEMYNATVAFFHHLHDEVGENPAKWEKDDLLKMGEQYWSLQGTVFEIHKRREDAAKAKP